MRGVDNGAVEVTMVFNVANGEVREKLMISIEQLQHQLILEGYKIHWRLIEDSPSGVYNFRKSATVAEGGNL